MNNKGITLLEMMVCLVILGIITMTMAALFSQANRTIARINKANITANNTLDMLLASNCVTLVPMGKSGNFKVSSVKGACK